MPNGIQQAPRLGGWFGANPFLRREVNAEGVARRVGALRAEWDRNVFAVDVRDNVWVEPDPAAKPKAGKRGEELFHLILSGLREIYNVEATIAGGAVRDFAVGYDHHKDVDVFIPMQFKDFKDGVKELGWQGGVRKVNTKSYDNPDVDTFQSNARGLSLVQNMQLDLIFCNKSLDAAAVDTFPIHAQRCVWTLDRGLVISPEAQKDLDNKTFTIDPKIEDPDRIERLKAKINEWKKRKEYKNWTIVEPKIIPWYEREE